MHFFKPQCCNALRESFLLEIVRKTRVEKLTAEGSGMRTRSVNKVYAGVKSSSSLISSRSHPLLRSRSRPCGPAGFGEKIGSLSSLFAFKGRLPVVAPGISCFRYSCRQEPPYTLSPNICQWSRGGWTSGTGRYLPMVTKWN